VRNTAKNKNDLLTQVLALVGRLINKKHFVSLLSVLSVYRWRFSHRDPYGTKPANVKPGNAICNWWA